MPDAIGAEQAPARPLAATNASLAGRLALCGIVLIAAALRGWRIDAGSFIVPYYLAGVRSQLESWHNFLFNAFDPAGFISLDKPPVAFWLQAASAELFGFGAVSVLLPQLAEGIGSVALLYALVRRYFGVAAGLLAALFLALTPLAVAVDRSNNTESCLILVLLLAAWALFRAIDSGRISPLLVSAAFVGIAFNVKMLVAFGVVPIFALVYLVATRPLSWWRLGWLSLAGVVLAALSLSWSLAYDLTPPAERPFAGSSDGNSMLELAVGHNGVERFVRRARTGGQVGALVAEPGSEPGAPTSGRDFAPAGPLRLVAPPLAAQIGWQFPIALAGGLAAWLRAAGRTPQRLAIALWAGWAVTYDIVLSAAGGLFHAYYIAVMAPALCALAGIGSVSLYTFYRAGGAAAALLPAAIAATALWQAYIVDFYREASPILGHSWLIPGFLAATGMTCAVLVWARQWRRTGLAVAGLGLCLLLGFPAVWSLGTGMTQRQTGFPAAQLPYLSAEAENGRWRYAHLAGALAPDPRLLDFLERRRHPGEVLLATANTRQAAPFIIATGAPVLALGGFNGHDQVVTPAGFARLVADKRIRFVLIGDGSPGIRRIFGTDAQTPLADWIRAQGRRVDPSLWRSTTYPIFGGVESRASRPAEMVDSELYDLRPGDPGGG